MKNIITLFIMTLFVILFEGGTVVSQASSEFCHDGAGMADMEEMAAMVVPATGKCCCPGQADFLECFDISKLSSCCSSSVCKTLVPVRDMATPGRGIDIDPPGGSAGPLYLTSLSFTQTQRFLTDLPPPLPYSPRLYIANCAYLI